jgi:hypothetical protein
MQPRITVESAGPGESRAQSNELEKIFLGNGGGKIKKADTIAVFKHCVETARKISTANVEWSVQWVHRLGLC